ncbi:hypothetical protein BHE74_00027657 [Ensete ventricosum]|nr:hypothetical protein BHE74_00027657 [Ensete ventricosum]
MPQCYASLAATSARGWALLPSSGNPCGLAAPPRAATWSSGPPTGAVTIGGYRCGWASRYRSPLLWAPCYRRLPLRVAAPAGDLAVASHPLSSLPSL